MRHKRFVDSFNGRIRDIAGAGLAFLHVKRKRIPIIHFATFHLEREREFSITSSEASKIIYLGFGALQKSEDWVGRLGLRNDLTMR